MQNMNSHGCMDCGGVVSNESIGKGHKLDGNLIKQVVLGGDPDKNAYTKKDDYILHKYVP